ncbi:Imm42 family immunity protein [Rhizobium sp. BR 314]|uniref:Imm42 family immunity protein n=1 Tax=Rhizobium sp. BR 314 TaxID=3040013 RepID=UPI0039BF2B6C
MIGLFGIEAQGKQMIVGDCRIFAIESGITEAVENLSQLALGYFAVYVGGRVFGVREPDASMLGCSFHEVEHRLLRRGAHAPPIPVGTPAFEIATAYLDAFYRDNARTDYLGLSQHQFIDALQSSGAIWAPDGDEAFDDGSHILQFDVDGRVRIIAFLNTEEPDDFAQGIREEWMSADLFYAIVSSWKTLFAVERTGRLKAKTAARPAAVEG